MFFSRPFVQYAKELNSNKYEPLSREKEKEILLQIASGSTNAKEQLINAHLRFVIYIVKDFKIPSQIDPMDLVQEGNLGLLDGISRFDISQNCRVSTYVQYYIRWYVGRALGFYDRNVIIYETSENFDIDSIEDTSVVEERAHQDILNYIKTFLDPKEVKIINLSFGLEYPFKPVTLKDIGSMMHLNSERIRQIRIQALEKIKNKQSGIEILR